MRPYLIIIFLFTFFQLSAQTNRQIRARGIQQVSTHTLTNGKSYIEIESYDKKGHLIRNCEFSEDSSEYKEMIYKFNNKGQKISELRYNSTDTGYFIKTEYAYTNLGSIKESLKKDQNGMIQKTIYQYNNQNDKTSEHVYDKSGNLVKRIEYEYDLTGLLTRRRVFNNLGQCQEDKIIKYNK